MNKLIIFPLLGSLSLALSLPLLAQNSDVNTVTVSPDRAAFIEQHRYPMQPDEFYKFKRTYELSNGMTVSLFNHGTFMYAKLNGQRPERLIATGSNTFYSTQSALKLKINLLDNDEARGEVLIPISATPEKKG